MGKAAHILCPNGVYPQSSSCTALVVLVLMAVCARAVVQEPTTPRKLTFTEIREQNRQKTNERIAAENKKRREERQRQRATAYVNPNANHTPSPDRDDQQGRDQNESRPQ